MKLALASDHGGVEIKAEVIKYLELKGIEYINFGTNNSEAVDYPLLAKQAAEAVANKEVDLGIVFCTSGIGVSIVANKVRGVRSAQVRTAKEVETTREHNASNVISLGQSVVDYKDIPSIIDAFINTKPSSEERHLRRVSQIEGVK